VTFDDEGIYVAQAWAVLREGRLSPYTYVYDHAPGGWILLAAWMWLTGGPHAFGSAIDTGRVLMLVLHLTTIPLLYYIARRLGCHPGAAAVGVLLYSVSPLAVYFRRLVLLDTIMVFWAVLSLTFLYSGREWPRRSRVAWSGLCFGVAVLSKETALVLGPALLFIAIWRRWSHRPRAALLEWLVPAAIIVALYPAYAALRGELLPAGETRFLFMVIDGGPPHISLVETLKWQATRDGGGLLNPDNMFWQVVRTDWIRRDPILLVGGVIAIGLNVARGISRRRALATGLLGLLPMAYLARGGLVYSFYIVAAIPFLCLNIAVALAPLWEHLRRWRALRQWQTTTAGLLTVVAGLIIVGWYWYAGTLQPLYVDRPGGAAREALAWVKQHVPANSKMIINDSWWADLHENGFGGPAIPHAHSHWKVALDGPVRTGIFKDDWKSVDYLLITAGTKDTFKTTNNAIALEALRHATLIKTWNTDDSAIELWQVERPGPGAEALLSASAAFIDSRFNRDGAHVRPDGTVTSQSQARAMLRAVWLGDQADFSQIWQWTQAHLLAPNGLLASAWKDGAIIDSRSASDADTDAALALLLASRRWNDSALERAGRTMVQSIWRHDVARAGGTPYLTAGDWGANDAHLLVRPSHLAPYAYHVFQEVDSEHDWLGLVGSSYRILLALTGASPAALPSCVRVDRSSGELTFVVSGAADQTVANQCDYNRADTAITYWRIALHRRWTVSWSPGGDGRAVEFLRQMDRRRSLSSAPA
ncbi:MAG TPA: glycosyl hydrolase family 8, partial [Chloroflexota bacterium]|nr:glycosyl hydrolase family 8 [Chloroflexota bacterium]